MLVTTRLCLFASLVFLLLLVGAVLILIGLSLWSCLNRCILSFLGRQRVDIAPVERGSGGDFGLAGLFCLGCGGIALLIPSLLAAFLLLTLGWGL